MIVKSLISAETYCSSQHIMKFVFKKKHYQVCSWSTINLVPIIKKMPICLLYLAPSSGLYAIKIGKATFGVRKNEWIWEEGVSYWSTVEVSDSALMRYPSGVSVKFDLVVISIAGLIQVWIEIVYSHQLWNKTIKSQKFTKIYWHTL